MKRAVEGSAELMANYTDLDKELDTIEKHFDAMGKLPEVSMNVEMRVEVEMRGRMYGGGNKRVIYFERAPHSCT